ncbi:hypothetical protein [Roseimaritima ulvae]|uniref:hypothetical protein n=1 Tax=Roseimaritima ulvae TaxID=980254 RepID=UPI0012F9AD18|nr:hypothetical protein [Roseimaritima ulvae]
MRSMLQILGRVGIWGTIAWVVILTVVPAQGLYYWFFEQSHPLFVWACLALVLIAAWGAWGPQSLLVRFSGSLALASLMVANLAFSASTIQKFSVLDGLALLGAFWLIPWLLLWGLRSIPRIGLQIGKQQDGEVRIVERPLGKRDVIATISFFAVILYAYAQAFPAAAPAGESWMESSRRSWGEGLSMGLMLTGVVAFALWSGLNRRKWLFVTVFGLLSLVCLNAFGSTLADNEFEIRLLPFLYALAAVIYIPVCLRWAGYRVVRRHQAVIVGTEQTEQVTTGRRASLWGSSLPVLVVALAWIVTANLSGAITRHALHYTGKFFYDRPDSPYHSEHTLEATLPSIHAERVLHSPLFRSLSVLTVSDAGEVNETLAEAALLHDQLRT